MSYTALQPDGSPQQTWETEGHIKFFNSVPPNDPGKDTMHDAYEVRRSSVDSDSVHGKPAGQRQSTLGSWFSRRDTGLSSKSWQIKAWEHKLNEKHLRKVPTDTDTVRYFDRSRQTRRVFWSCFAMWLVTAVICGALAATMTGFSSLQIISKQQKYTYNALVTGLSISLGLAFAAQFKQYCEMMRWRFLASSYRTIDDFEDVLDCDSWRATLKLIFMNRKKGQYYPTKAQLLAFFWLVIFIAFNVFTALLGLTYSIDVSETYVSINKGNVSVVDLSYIATLAQPDPSAYNEVWQQMAANLYGQTGQSFDLFANDTIDSGEQFETPTVFTSDFSTYWYRFVDRAPDSATQNVITDRTINATATCQELNITYGGYAGYQYTPPDKNVQGLEYIDSFGVRQYMVVDEVASGLTTYMGNTSDTCGPRCSQVLVLASANNQTEEDVAVTKYNFVPYPRLWTCNNTMAQVTNLEGDGFENTTRLELPDLQARIIAGAIGWSGVSGTSTDDTTTDPLQYQIIHGNNGYNLNGNATKYDVAALIMRFSTSAIAAMDLRGGPRLNMTGFNSPSAAQTINVKWKFAGAILAGIPVLQFIMLLAVVYFSSKAIILEPSYLTAAHLLYPVMHKLGPGGVLMSVDEIAEKLGKDFKVAYSVRPDGSDPGHGETELVRDLDLVEEKEGLGYLRGKMPEGRYD